MSYARELHVLVYTIIMDCFKTSQRKMNVEYLKCFLLFSRIYKNEKKFGYVFIKLYVIILQIKKIIHTIESILHNYNASPGAVESDLLPFVIWNDLQQFLLHDYSSNNKRILIFASHSWLKAIFTLKH